MAFKDGDFLEIEYTAWDAVNGNVLATTDEKVAKDADIYSKDAKYGPVLVVIGSNAVVKGLESELRTMNTGETKEFTLEPKDAFGERIEDLVKVMPIAQFRAQKIDPRPGMRLNIDNVAATVVSVGSGRVVVDANHPDAGKRIKYQVKVVSKLGTETEMIEALGKTYDVLPTKIAVNGNEAEIFYDGSVKKDADYFVNRASLIAAVFTYVKQLGKVYVREEYNKSEGNEKRQEE